MNSYTTAIIAAIVINCSERDCNPIVVVIYTLIVFLLVLFLLYFSLALPQLRPSPAAIPRTIILLIWRCLENWSKCWRIQWNACGGIGSCIIICLIGWLY